MRRRAGFWPLVRFLAALFVLSVSGLLASGFPVVPALAADVPEPKGYRLDEYRAPVPDTLAGARVIDAREAHDLWEQKAAAFVDVMPRPPKPKGLPAGTLWRQPPRQSIPGSLWLANAGYGDLAPEMESYFLNGLQAATGGDRTRPLVIFCQAGCWMSWNAAKRALAHGYRQVLWLPEGMDGWSAEGYPVEDLQPEPGGL
ncbi:PQQ-dependent catabolism-associated CXXCW motif protein [Roseibium aestuarii]|uniref:PQQ-dependent catabolism-associated CXXCW motif protein n=1 Tax=Roseibium aestuarii TaxID=2600299 RepID=A0ABW4JWX2_9HYPH|nr:PQQ-dependent catabolism-associated CXXCW motif protein [Roseibium aestuarii]